MFTWSNRHRAIKKRRSWRRIHQTIWFELLKPLWRRTLWQCHNRMVPTTHSIPVIDFIGGKQNQVGQWLPISWYWKCQIWFSHKSSLWVWHLIFNENGDELRPMKSGCKTTITSWKGIWENEARFKASYFSKFDSWYIIWRRL
jgi:hypothetical protein